MAIIHADFRFIEIEYELWALGHLRTVVEDQVVFLRHQDTQRTFAELRDQGWDHDEGERQLASQELDERQNFVIPRFFRGPFVVSLWASYESAVKEVAEYYQTKRGASLGWRDIRASNVLMQLDKYFHSVLGVPVDDHAERFALLEDLRAIRNAIAHANGKRRAMSDDQWRTVARVLKRRGVPPDEYRGVIILSESFVRDAYEAVNASLRALVGRARAA